MELKKIKSAIESIMFVYSEPVSKYKLSKAVDVSESLVYTALKELTEEYIKDDKGIRIVEVNGKYQLGSNKHNHKYLEEFCKKSPNKGLSKSALEVLAIIAYKQPVTRIDIEGIRGVRSGTVIKTLLDRNLVEIKGRLETIGNPIIYSTNEMFLKSFGFDSIKELPEIEDFHNFEFLANFNLQREELENDKNKEVKKN